MFNSTLGNWTRLPSQRLADTTGALQQRIHVTNVSEENVGESALRDVRIQPEGAPTGKYVLFFTGPQTYRLFLAPSVDDTRALEALEVIALSEQLENFTTDFPSFRHGFSLNVELDFENPFAFGDVLTFNVTSLIQSPDVDPESRCFPTRTALVCIRIPGFQPRHGYPQLRGTSAGHYYAKG